MANKNLTHEGIHSGLSLSKQDSKWSDMLNFRSNNNRTYVVPSKYKLLERDAGFHTVLHGIGGLNYAIGSKESWVFYNNDHTLFRRLWEVKARRVAGTDDLTETIKIRGAYQGEAPVNIRLTFIDGKLIPDYNWTVDPEPEVEPEFVPELNCGVRENKPLLKLGVFSEIDEVDPEWSIGDYNSYQEGQFVKYSGDLPPDDPDLYYIALRTFRVMNNFETSSAGGGGTLSNAKSNGHLKEIFWISNVQNKPTPYYTINAGNLMHNGDRIYQCVYTFLYYTNFPSIAYPPTGTHWTDWFIDTGEDFVESNMLEWKTFNYTHYKVDDKVINSAVHYKCILEHDSSNATNPGVGVDWETYWEVSTPTFGGVPAAGAVVSVYNGVIHVGDFRTNPSGLLDLYLSEGHYKLVITYPSFPVKIYDFDMPDSDYGINVLLS